MCPKFAVYEMTELVEKQIFFALGALETALIPAIDPRLTLCLRINQKCVTNDKTYLIINRILGDSR